MSLVSSIEWEACLLEPRPDAELKRAVERESGVAPTATLYLSPVPEIARLAARLNKTLRSRIHLPGDLADMVGLVVSQDNSCRFCYAYQRALLQGMGFSLARIEQLEQDFAGGSFTPAERRAFEFARRVSRSNPMPGEADKAALREAGFSDPEILELLSQIGLMVFHNRLATVPALPSGRVEELPDKWYAKLLQPVAGWYLSRLFQRVAPEPLLEDERRGPFSEIVVAFDGLPFARTLRDAIDVTLQEGALRRRSKAMLFAVVARALGCNVCEAEAGRVLVDEGMAPEVVESILAHLTAPELDDVEARIVPFARDTVWYSQATPIQQRAREVRDAMKLEGFLEMISAIAVANMVCRLGVALPGDARA